MNINIISKREREVLILVANEKTTSEIATQLHISTHTAITHRQNMMTKLDVRNTAGLVRKAFEIGLLYVNPPIHKVSSRPTS